MVCLNCGQRTSVDCHGCRMCHHNGEPEWASGIREVDSTQQIETMLENENSRQKSRWIQAEIEFRKSPF